MCLFFLRERDLHLWEATEVPPTKTFKISWKQKWKNVASFIISSELCVDYVREFYPSTKIWKYQEILVSSFLGIKLNIFDILKKITHKKAFLIYF